MRYLLKLSFNGTHFFGWAKQPEFRSVQESVETALSQVLPKMWGKPVPTIVSGRTDTGVHCKEQYVHFDFDGELNHNFLFKLNSVLPDDIVALAISEVPSDFSARFWAKSRTYSYRIADEISARNPIQSDNVFWCKSKLDVKKMNSVAKHFCGLHDFSAFVKPRQGQTPIRNLKAFNVKKVKFGHDRGLIVITLKADAFAHNMCRSLVGALLMVGDGRRDAKWMKSHLKTKTREGATGPIAAKGLTLEKIKFPLGFNLNSKTRNNYRVNPFVRTLRKVSAANARKRELRIKRRR